MNTDHPHDIVDHVRLKSLSPDKRSTYVEITADEVEYLQGKTAEERGRWLAQSFRKRLADILRQRSVTP